MILDEKLYFVDDQDYHKLYIYKKELHTYVYDGIHNMK